MSSVVNIVHRCSRKGLNASEQCKWKTWLTQVSPLMTMGQMCLSVKLIRAQETEPVGFLGHTGWCLESPFPPRWGTGSSIWQWRWCHQWLPSGRAWGPPETIFGDRTPCLCDRRECIHKVSIEAREVQNGASKPPISASPDPALLPPSYHSLTGDSWLNREKTHSRERTREGRTHCKSSANKNMEPRGSLRIFLNPACRELWPNQLEWTQERNPIGHPRDGKQNALGFSRPEFKSDPVTCIISDKIVHLHLEFLHL